MDKRELDEKIDELLHDAEHAEAGANFAAMMALQDSDDPTYAQDRDELLAKAKRLREEAAALEAQSCPRSQPQSDRPRPARGHKGERDGKWT